MGASEGPGAAGARGPTASSAAPAAGAPAPAEHPNAVVYIPRSEIERARLFRYTADSFNGWGLGGSLSTITHFLALVVTLPIWIVSWSAAESAETRSAILEYPGDRLEDMAPWARFPQGMPPGLDPRDLVPTRADPPRAIVHDQP